MQIVIGLGYGDEGKGLTTAYLTSLLKNPLVVRFNGGHQAGHTVLHDGHRHVFSSFGSGTLLGAPTYWSKHCTFYPTAWFNEFNAIGLLMGGYRNVPKFNVHALAPVVTPFDVFENQNSQSDKLHGTVGVGFGSTIERHEQYYKLYVRDLFHPTVLEAKLLNIGLKYYKKYEYETIDVVKDFMKKVEQVLPHLTLIEDDSDEYWLLNEIHKGEVVFEGAQGILLDMDFGFFPNVTRSNCTSKNAMEIIGDDDYAPDGSKSTEIFYVTRSYQTRHGAGFMSNETALPRLINDENETNRKHKFQGEFRKSILDFDMLKYSMLTDRMFAGVDCKKNLVITCVDQTGDKFYVTQDKLVLRVDAEELAGMLMQHVGFDNVYVSKSDDYTKIEKI